MLKDQRYIILTLTIALAGCASKATDPLAVFLYNEPVPQVRWVTFVFIWSALAIFTIENVYDLRKRRRIAQARIL